MFNLFAAYFISWLLFAIVWYIIGLIHGKIRIIPQTHAYISWYLRWLWPRVSGVWPCGLCWQCSGLHLGLSFQCGDTTHHWVSGKKYLPKSLTICYFRYGGRATTTECPTAIVMMCVQSVIGIFIEVRLSAANHEMILQWMLWIHVWMLRPVWLVLCSPSSPSRPTEERPSCLVTRRWWPWGTGPSTCCAGWATSGPPTS